MPQLSISPLMQAPSYGPDQSISDLFELWLLVGDSEVSKSYTCIIRVMSHISVGSVYESTEIFDGVLLQRMLISTITSFRNNCLCSVRSEATTIVLVPPRTRTHDNSTFYSTRIYNFLQRLGIANSMVVLNWYTSVATWMSLSYSVNAYYPVYIIHGVLSSNVSMSPLSRRIQQMHPGTAVYVTSMYEDWASLEPMWRQIENYGKEFVKFSNTHPEGFHLIGYSQGGLIARALLEKFSKHNVRTFISLSSPQAGQYGTKFLHLFFPELALQEAYKVFYSVAGQLTSIGNYWNDPHEQDLYMQYSAFLPLINNEVLAKVNASYKQGITKLQQMVLLGGPDDGVITPWQSSLFDYYDKAERIVDMKDRHVYLSDYLGLRDLDNRGKLKRFVVEGVEHHHWRKNLTVIDNYILPYLD